MAIKMGLHKFNVNNLGNINHSHSGKLFFPKKIQSLPSNPQFFTSSSSSSSCSIATIEKSTNYSSKKPNLLGHLWREIQGSNNWDNLINPTLHPLLRQEVIRYGEFVTACYKAFDLDPNSKRFLSCKYGKHSMLQQVGMEDSGYEVTKYIYATPDINIPIQNGSSCGRWIGYVAVSSDDAVEKLGRRDIVITFRGTVTNHEWVANFMSSLTPARLDPNNPRPDVKVESGFLSLYTCDESDNKFGIESCRQQLLSEVSRLLSLYKGEEVSISVAGHSMGSSLALLLAYDISELGLNRVKSNPRGGGDVVVAPVTVFSFGGPRVGNGGFKERCEELGVRVLRIVNVNDPITKLPGVLMNENFRVLGGTRFEFPWSCSCYAHVGVELELDFFNFQNPSCVHDLEAYIGNLLKLKNCPKKITNSISNNIGANIIEEVDHDHEEEDFNFISRLKEALIGAQNLNILPLGISLSFTNFFNFLHSQKSAEILFDENIYILMNNLALYVLL